MGLNIKDKLYSKASEVITPLTFFAGQGSFGDITFQVNSFRMLTPNSFTRSMGLDTTKHSVILAPPITEFKSRQLETATCSITLFHEKAPIDETIAKLRRMLANGEHHPLILKKVIGDNTFILTKVSQAIKRTDSFGNIILAELSLTFEEYISEIDRGGLIADIQKEVFVSQDGAVESNNQVFYKKLGEKLW